jgi:ABC-type transport system substrate-binding protein
MEEDQGWRLTISWRRSATWSHTRVTRDFALYVDPYGSSMIGDRDAPMVKFILGSSANFGRFSEPLADALFDKQKPELGEQKRIEPVKEVQKALLQKAWWIPRLWWTPAEARTGRLHNYEPHPSHWMNRRLEDAWLSAKRELFALPHRGEGARIGGWKPCGNIS